MLQPTPSAQGASTSTETRRRQQVSIRRIQRTIGTLAEDLRALDALIGGIAQELPPARETFDALAEVGEGLRCVKADLLADAVETLQVIATSTEADLLRRFEQRQSWLEAEGARKATRRAISCHDFPIVFCSTGRIPYPKLSCLRCCCIRAAAEPQRWI